MQLRKGNAEWWSLSNYLPVVSTNQQIPIAYTPTMYMGKVLDKQSISSAFHFLLFISPWDFKVDLL